MSSRSRGVAQVRIGATVDGILDEAGAATSWTITIQFSGSSGAERKAAAPRAVEAGILAGNHDPDRRVEAMRAAAEASLNADGYEVGPQSRPNRPITGEGDPMRYADVVRTRVTLTSAEVW